VHLPRFFPVTFLLFAVTICCPAALAQKYLFDRLEMATGHSPEGVAVGDFNKDGLIDFAVANNADGTISVYLGKPDGTFNAPVTYSTGTASAPTGLVAADFNGDGKLDLAAALNGANTVAILTGTGSGTFNAPVSFSVGTGPVALVAADFNGDKKTDLAVANYTASSVSILINNSTVTKVSFTAGATHATGINPTAVIAADFNADKKMDLAVASFGSNEVSVMLGTGSGTFGTAIIDNIGQPVWSVAAADFDNDGKLDLVSGTLFGTALQLGKGDGTFEATNFLASPTGAYALYAVDVTGDKKVDLITVDDDKFNGSYTISVLINTTTTIGNPTFAFPPRSYAVGYQARGIAMADFNFDGKLDAVVTGSGSNTVSVLLGDGRGHFDPGVSGAVGHSECEFITEADFNNDHKLDAAISCVAGSVQVFLGKGNGTFNPPISLTAGTFSTGVVAADFDGDGFMDLAVTNQNSNNVSVFLNNKAGGFNAAVNYSTGNGPFNLVAGNFRLTGHTDLAVVNTVDQTMQIFPGKGDGTFGTPVTSALPANANPEGIVAGDFNNDGKLDLAVANVNTSSVSIFLNNGGTFPTRTDISVAGQPSRIAAASLRNTGVLDLVTTNPASGTVAVLLGKNNGTFAAPVFYAGVGGVLGLRIADFNHDGFLDVAVANGSNAIGILPGKGDGTLMPLIRYVVGVQSNSSQPFDVAAGDFNGDGFPDFVTTNYGDGTYTAYMNTPVAALHPGGMAFPTLLLGTSSSAQTATVYSSGVATLLPKITISPSDYSISSNTCGASLASGLNCSLSVTFSPKDINTRSGALMFGDNATDSPQKASLSGAGSAVGVNPDPVSFGSIAHGTTTKQVVTITNLSGGSFPSHNVTFTVIAASGTGFTIVTDGCPLRTSSLAPGANCKVTLQFAPTTTGKFNGALTLTDNGGGSPQKITLTGTGT
jgi:hypothetical protein